jgi:ABC-type xylose transport system permease subunit
MNCAFYVAADPVVIKERMDMIFLLLYISCMYTSTFCKSFSLSPSKVSGLFRLSSFKLLVGMGWAMVIVLRDVDQSRSMMEAKRFLMGEYGCSGQGLV